MSITGCAARRDGGKFPQPGDEFLKKLPTDPFTDGKPFKYAVLENGFSLSGASSDSAKIALTVKMGK